jgi:hypothetical protein
VTIQRNHPVDQILGDISKGVTTRSRLANFCEHYSFVSSIEPFRIEEALLDLDWVLAMQEELNNFKRNEVWYRRFGPEGGSLDRRLKLSLRAPAQMGWRGMEHKRWGKPCIILHQGCRS